MFANFKDLSWTRLIAHFSLSNVLLSVRKGFNIVLTLRIAPRLRKFQKVVLEMPRLFAACRIVLPWRNGMMKLVLIIASEDAGLSKFSLFLLRIDFVGTIRASLCAWMSRFWSLFVKQNYQATFHKLPTIALNENGQTNIVRKVSRVRLTGHSRKSDLENFFVKVSNENCDEWKIDYFLLLILWPWSPRTH